MIQARRFRTQERNRQDAIERLLDPPRGHGAANPATRNTADRRAGSTARSAVAISRPAAAQPLRRLSIHS